MPEPVAPATNEAGLVTLFGQRPFWHCTKHDEYLCNQNEDPMWHWCYYCTSEWRKADKQEADDRLTRAIVRALREMKEGPTC